MTVYLFKIKVYQDECIPFNELSFFKKLNCWYNEQAKELILIANNNTFIFLFTLLFSYLMNSITKRILSIKEQITHYLDIIQSSSYIERKLNVKIDEIDQEIRKKIMKKIPKYLHIWVSKSLWNFASTEYRMKQYKQWQSSICRCCLNEEENDATHYIVCQHNNLVKEHDIVFNNICNTITEFDCRLELKELIYQRLMNNDDYYPLTYLSVINSEIKKIRRRYLWHRILLIALMKLLYHDRRIASVILVKLGIKCRLDLHKMQTTQYIIIHQIITNNIIIEEMNNIRDEIEMIQYSNQYYELVNSKKIRPIRLTESLSVSNMKGWLFNFYSITTDY